MRKAVSILLLCSTLFALSACGTGKVEESAGGGLKDTQEALSEESAQEISENIAKTESYTGSNILIAYFTWADNTSVEDKDAAVQSALSHYDSVGDSADYDGVDATTSASVYDSVGDSADYDGVDATTSASVLPPGAGESY